MAQGGSPLSSSAGSIPPPVFPETPYAPASPPPRRRRTRLIVAVVVVVIVLFVSVIALSYFVAPAPPVQVSYINMWAPDNVCGFLTNADANPVSYYGFNGSTGEVQTLEFPVPNFNSTSCTIATLVTNTTGFALSDVQVPLAIPGNGTGSMNITITSPSASYSGNLNFVLS